MVREDEDTNDLDSYYEYIHIINSFGISKVFCYSIIDNRYAKLYCPHYFGTRNGRCEIRKCQL